MIVLRYSIEHILIYIDVDIKEIKYQVNRISNAIENI